ncbi:MAG TPA: TonB-dependent receptor [Gemmatimonadales bacterium]|nr:TonB-dependent receptor [Gemmatimonadales bacterium]
MRPSLVALILCVIPAALAGQVPADTVALKPVVVTATRLPTPASELPAAVTVLDGAALRAAGIHTVYEALREVPAAAIVQQGSFGGVASLFLRGGQSNYVKVLLDGVPLNDPGGSFDFSSLSTEGVERIEVLRGPASVLYGSDAVTGVVQIFTTRGSAKTRGEATFDGGAYGTLAWSARLSGTARAVSYSVGASRATSDGMYSVNNNYDNTVVTGHVRFAPDDRTDAALTVRYGDDTYHFPTNGAGDTLADRNQFTHGSGPTVGLDAGHRFSQRVEGRVLIAASGSDGGYDNAPDSAGDPNLFRSQDKLRRASADARANITLGPGTVLTTGGVLEREGANSTNECESAFGSCSSPPIDTTRWNRALYAQLVSDPRRRVSLVAGGRLESNERFGTYATYRGGVAWRLARGTRARATVGSAFREPTFFENFSTGFTTGNPDLEPEHSHCWEVGLEQSLGGAPATFSTTVFGQRFANMIDYDPNAAPGAPNYRNVAEASADGVELGVQVSPEGGLSLGASYTYLATNVITSGFDSSQGAALAAGQPLLRRPKHSGRFDAAYRVRGRGSASLSVTYVGERADQDFSTFPAPRVMLPSYARVDLGGEAVLVRPHAGTPGVTARLRVENLFNASYEEVKNYPARPRVLFLGAQVRFGD